MAEIVLIKGDKHDDAAHAIQALVCGYAPKIWPKKLMVALQAFVDDSAADTGDRRLFLAGYIGSATQWIQFSRAWDRELRKPPAIDYLKMSEAAGLDGPFKGWRPSDRDDKVLALARIVRAYQPWFVYCSVSRAEYARILAPVAPWPLKNPYFDCFWGVIHTAARYQAEFAPNGAPIDFIFDEQGGTGLQAVMWYGWLKEDQDDPLIRRSLGATPIFRDDKDVLPLQAADMLAWHLRRGHERPEEDFPIKALLMTEGASVYIDAASLEQTARKFRRVPGVRLAQNRPRLPERQAHDRRRTGRPGPRSTDVVRLPTAANKKEENSE